MKKVILFNPKPAELGRFIGVPLNLLTLTPLIKSRYKIKIFDFIDHGLEKRILKESEDALCMGISAITGYQIKEGLRIARLVKEKFPDIPIIWGGWHPSILPLQTIKNPYVDIVVKGQGAKSLSDVVDALNSNKPLDNIRGIVSKKDGKIKENPNREFEGIDGLYPLPFELIDVKKYITKTEIGSKTINYITSEGCPFRCGFCATLSVNKMKWVGAKPKLILDDMERLVKKYGINAFIINDNNFFVNEKRVRKICKGVLERKLNIKWGRVNGRTDTLSNLRPSTWELLEKSGLESVLIGAESSIQENLDIIQKGTTIEQTFKVAKLCKKHNVKIQFSFFIGLPGSTTPIKDEFNSIIDVIIKLRKIERDNFFYIFTFSPYPGTPLYQKSLELGFKEPKTLEEWANLELFMGCVPWVPKKYAERAYQTNFYFPILSNNIAKVISSYPFYTKVLLKPIERLLYLLFTLRFKFKFFALPLEYMLIKNSIPIMKKFKFTKKIIGGLEE